MAELMALGVFGGVALYSIFGNNQSAPRPNMGNMAVHKPSVPTSVSSANATAANDPDVSMMQDTYASAEGMKGRHPFESCLQQQGNWVSSNLLPNDTANISKDWSVSVPGKISDKNFLQAGYHYGRDTVGSSLRNANMQLRSEPIIPRVDVSPWMNSTMEPDEKRRRFDLQDF